MRTHQLENLVDQCEIHHHYHNANTLTMVDVRTKYLSYDKPGSATDISLLQKYQNIYSMNALEQKERCNTRHSNSINIGRYNLLHWSLPSRKP